MSAPARAEGLVLAWARTYTRGLDERMRTRRLGELASDCHEQRHWGREVGAPPVVVAASMVARTLAGVPADVLWRQHQIAASRDRSPNPGGAVMGRWMKDNWWVALAVVTGLFVTAMGVGLPFEDRTTGALVGGIVIALLGLTMLAGVVVRRRRRVRGDLMIAVGTLPLYPFLWTIVFPLVGLAVLIPAVLDAADARALGSGDAERPVGADEPGRAGRDPVALVLLALSAVAVAAAVAIGEQEAAFALVSPPVSLLVAHLLFRRGRFATTVRVGLTALVASVIHGVVSVAMLLAGDPGIVDTSGGPSYAANSFMGAVGFAGLVLLVVGLVRSRDQARPA